MTGLIILGVVAVLAAFILLCVFLPAVGLTLLGIIVLLIVLVLAMLLSFKTLDATAARLNIPYLLWLVLAAWLNMSVYLLNK